MKKAVIILLSLLHVFSNAQDTTGLFISEYIENSWTKALEIFNPTRDTINLKYYKLVRNGTFAFQMPDQELKPHGVWVGGRYDPGHPPAPEVLAVADSTWPAAGSIWYLSNTARIELLKNDQLIDRINFSQPNDTVAGVPGALEKHTLIRKNYIHHGDTIWDRSRGTDTDNSQWIVKSLTYDFLGEHDTDLPDPTKDTLRTIDSDLYTISDDTIFVPLGTSVDTFLLNIDKPEKARLFFFNILGNPKKSSIIHDNDILRVTSELGLYNTYFFNTSASADSLIYVESMVYYISDNAITNVESGTDIQTFLNGFLFLPDGITAQVTDEGLLPKSGSIANGDKLSLTSLNGATQKIYTILTITDPVVPEALQVHNVAVKREVLEGLPRYSDILFTSRWPRGEGLRPYDTWEAAKSFHATRSEWCYLTNVSDWFKVKDYWIEKSLNLGFDFGAALNWNLPDEPGGSTSELGRAEDMDGNPLIRFDALGCHNSPQYQKIYLEHALVQVERGASHIQMDDPDHSYMLVMGGCYCDYCKAKAAAMGVVLSSSTQNYFQRQTYLEFHKRMHFLIDAYAGRDIKFSCNNSSWHVWDEIMNHFDYAVGECDPRWGYGFLKYFNDERNIAEKKGKMQVYNLSVKGLNPDDVTLKWRNRSMMGFSFGVGSNCVFPWDTYMDTDLDRYFGTPDDYSDITGFIRANSRYLEGFETAYDHVPGYSDERYEGSKPLDIQDNSRAIAFLRVIPGDPLSPAVIHLIDWKEDSVAVPITVTIKPGYFFNGRPFGVYLVTPPAFDPEIHNNIINKADLYRKPGELRGPQHEAIYASLADWKKIPFTREGANLVVPVGKIPTYAMIILIPEGISFEINSEILAVDNNADVIKGLTPGIFTSEFLEHLVKIPGSSWMILDEKNDPVYGQVEMNHRLVILSSDESLIKSYFLIDGDMPELAVKHGETLINLNDLVLFTDAIVGSENTFETFTLTNTGGSELVIDSIISENPSFQVSSTIDTLAAGASGSFDLTFSPSRGGPDSSMICIRTVDKTEIPFNFQVKGSGLSPVISVEQAGESIALGYGNISFGEVKDISDTTLAITIRNTGNAALEISSITSNYPDIFVVINPVISIPGDSADEFFITFNPEKAGLITGMINVRSNDPRISEYMFMVEGIGIVTYPDIVIRQGGIDLLSGNGQFHFDTLYANEDSTAVFSIHNTGENILIISGISSDNPVILVNSDIDTIPAGSFDTFSIKYDPTTQGTSIATISINSNDPDESPYTFVVKGVYKIPVNVEENSAGNGLSGIRIYPNPTSGNLTIEAASNLDVKVWDIYGRLILTKQICDFTTVLDLGGLKGIVILEIRAGKGQFKKMIVVE